MKRKIGQTNQVSQVNQVTVGQDRRVNRKDMSSQVASSFKRTSLTSPTNQTNSSSILWLIVEHLPGKRQLAKAVNFLDTFLSDISVLSTRRLNTHCETLVTAVLPNEPFLTKTLYYCDMNDKLSIRLVNNNVHSLRSNLHHSLHNPRWQSTSGPALRVGQEVWLIFSYGILANQTNQTNQTNQSKQTNDSAFQAHVLKLFQTAINNPKYSLCDEFNDETDQQLDNVRFVAVKMSKNPTHKNLLGRGRRWRRCSMFFNVLAIATIKDISKRPSQLKQSKLYWQDLAESFSNNIASVGEGWLVEQLDSTHTIRLAREMQIQQV